MDNLTHNESSWSTRDTLKPATESFAPFPLNFAPTMPRTIHKIRSRSNPLIVDEQCPPTTDCESPGAGASHPQIHCPYYYYYLSI